MEKEEKKQVTQEEELDKVNGGAGPRYVHHKWMRGCFITIKSIIKN